VYINEGVVIPGGVQGEGSKVNAPKTSGGGKTPVHHTIPLGIIIFLALLLEAVSIYRHEAVPIYRHEAMSINRHEAVSIYRHEAVFIYRHEAEFIYRHEAVSIN